MIYGVVYKIVDMVNWRVYVGQTIDLKKRIGRHLSLAAVRERPPLYIDQMIRQIGKEKFIFNIIDRADNARELCQLEDYWIDFFSSLNPEYGYNRRKNSYFSPESRLKISRANTGKIRTPEVREKLRQANLGKSPPNKMNFTVEQIDVIKELRNSGYTLFKIAQQFNISRPVIKRLLVKYNSEKPRLETWNKTKLTTAQLDQIKQLKKDGYGTRKIAKIMNLSRDRVIGIFKILN